MRNYTALVAFLESRRNMPFAWGSSANDCASFAALAVEAQTGFNPIGDADWASEAEAYDVIERLGGLTAALDQRLRRVAPAMARRGDLAGVMQGNDIGLLVVETATLVGPGVRRVVRRPRSDMRFAWSAD